MTLSKADFDSKMAYLREQFALRFGQYDDSYLQLVLSEYLHEEKKKLVRNVLIHQGLFCPEDARIAIAETQPKLSSPTPKPETPNPKVVKISSGKKGKGKKE